MEEKTIANVKVKTKNLCIACEEELDTISLGGDNSFGFFANSRGAFYCKNNKCKYFGYITVGVRPQTEQVLDFKKEDKK